VGGFCGGYCGCFVDGSGWGLGLGVDGSLFSCTYGYGLESVIDFRRSRARVDLISTSSALKWRLEKMTVFRRKALSF